jgi:DNA-binding LacI/PurR family transcriptional regulator
MVEPIVKSGKDAVQKIPPHRVTSYDVARVAGVSQSAVSRCFKPGASVSKKMKDRVMKAADELGYHPNAIARSLITRRSNLVAVIISNLTNLYYPEVLSQLTQRFSDKGIRVLLFALESEGQTDEMLQQVFQYQVDGVVAAVKFSDNHIEDFRRRNVPLVFYNRFATDIAVNAVCCDQAEGARSLVNRLHNTGLKRFAFIDGPLDSIIAVERRTASLDQLKQLGITKVPVLPGDFSYDCGQHAIDELANSEDGIPDAVICANDMTAIGAIDALRSTYKKRVPEDVSVVGFDGIGAASWTSFDLTTIRQPVRRMTNAAVSMLMELIEDPTLPPEKRLFSGIMITGGSARAEN